MGDGAQKYNFTTLIDNVNQNMQFLLIGVGDKVLK